MSRKPQKNLSPGFTLIEILVALLITSILTVAIYSFFIGQHHAYTVQDQVIEMEQNARAAMDMIRRDLRMAGYHAMGDDLINNLSDFVPSSFIPTSPVTVNLDANPKISEGSSVTDPDMITFLSVVPTTNNPTTISTAVSAGATQITLALNNSDTDSQYNVGDMIHIGTTSEYATVTAISGNTLTIDTNPAVSGSNQGLAQDYAADTPVGEIYVVSYAVFNDDNDSSNDKHDSGHPVLKRKANGGGFQPVAENITDMQLHHLGSGEIEVILSSRTDRADHKFQSNGGYRTYTANARIKSRNTANVAVGTDCPLPGAPAIEADGLDETRPCEIDITWAAVPVAKTDCEVTGYKVFYSTSSNGFYDGSVDVGNVTTYTLDVTGLNVCTYYIAVAAVNDAGTGPKSEVKEIPKPGVIPAVPAVPTWPTELPAENINGVERKVVLSWDKNTECDLQGYNIERKLELDSDINFDQINDSIISKELDTYTDIDFGTPTVIEEIDCQTYAYRIQAVDYCFPSDDLYTDDDWSTEVTAGPTPPAPPTGPVFETDGTSDTLSWTLSTDDFVGLNDLNYIKEYHVEYTPDTPEGSSPVVVTLDAGTNTWTSNASNSYYDVSAFDACGNESEKLSFSSVCIDTLPAIAITSHSENDSVSGTETISGTATAASTRNITKVRLKIDDTAWVDVSGDVSGTDSWSYNWNTRGEVEGAHTITIGAYDSQNCYTQESVSVSVSNSDAIVQDLQCKLFGCGGADEYAYLLAYVYDGTVEKPVSGAAIAADIAVGPNFYELEPTDEFGYYGGGLTPPCTMETDGNERPIANNIAIKSQQKFRSGTVTVKVKKDDKESTCSWTLSDGSGQ
jgi:prepilin-type N-terminal cleavage/methylation domain-containing protein